MHRFLNPFFEFACCKKKDSKELSPRPLENAPKTFNSKKTLRFYSSKAQSAFNANDAPKSSTNVKNA